MKKLFFFATFSLILLLIGCDSNSGNNPVSPNSIDKPALSVGTVNTGAIKIDQKLIDPIGYKNYYQVDGNINYSEELLNQNSVTTALGHEAKLGITLTATVSDKSSSTGQAMVWKVSSEKESLINLPASGTDEFVRYYPVIGSTDGLILVCTFEATTHGLLLKNIDFESQRV